VADDPREHIRQQPRFHLLYLAIALMGVFLLRDVWVASTQVEKIPYSEFQRLLAEGRIAEVVVSGDTIEGTFQVEHEGKPRFVTNKVEPGLAEALDEQGVTYSSRPRNELLPTLLSWLVPSRSSSRSGSS
jgi:cell division protease FtsH